jgi:hypothetical protein
MYIGLARLKTGKEELATESVIQMNGTSIIEIGSMALARIPPASLIF